MTNRALNGVEVIVDDDITEGDRWTIRRNVTAGDDWITIEGFDHRQTDPEIKTSDLVQALVTLEARPPAYKRQPMSERHHVYRCVVHGLVEACEMYESYDRENDRPGEPQPTCPVFSAPDSCCGFDLEGPLVVEVVAFAKDHGEDA